MKKITLQSLTLRNFRGEKERTTEFSPDQTTIFGANGRGKSRHFSAFLWLLFGKDEFDRKDFNVRTVANGDPLHKVECSVSAVLDVDGAAVTLKRAFTEKWVKPRGQAEEVLKGNETETFWNGVPVSVTDYQRRVSELVEESVFKMVTSPSFFVGMKWQDQREQLFRLAGTGNLTNAEIAAANPDLAAFVASLSGKSLDEFKREVAARKKRLKDELAQVQPRIDQTQKLMPAPADFAALDAEAAALDAQLSDIDKAITSKVEAARRQGEAARKKQEEINELKKKQQQVLFDAQNKSTDERAGRTMLKNNIKSHQTEVSFTRRTLERYQAEAAALERRLAERRQAVAALRDEWAKESAKEYQGDDICHACNQPLPEAMKADVRKLFDELKTEKMNEIKQQGDNINKEIAAVEGDIRAAQNAIDEAQARLKEVQDALSQLQEELDQHPARDEKEVNPADLPEYATLADLIKTLESALASQPTTAADELQEQRRNLSERRDAVRAALKDRDLIAQHTAEIAALEARGKDLAQQIANAEREEYAAQQLTRAKIEACENRINSLFTLVRFKLFSYTIDGNEAEACEPLIGGVPFGVANTAAQVNAGLDIINVLCQFYGVSAPIFVDRRESVNDLIPTESQIINLVVSNDEELVIK